MLVSDSKMKEMKRASEQRRAEIVGNGSIQRILEVLRNYLDHLEKYEKSCDIEDLLAIRHLHEEAKAAFKCLDSRNEKALELKQQWREILDRARKMKAYETEAKEIGPEDTYKMLVTHGTCKMQSQGFDLVSVLAIVRDKLANGASEITIKRSIPINETRIITTGRPNGSRPKTSQKKGARRKI